MSLLVIGETEKPYKNSIAINKKMCYYNNIKNNKNHNKGQHKYIISYREPK